jgi:hypothetical protein
MPDADDTTPEDMAQIATAAGDMGMLISLALAEHSEKFAHYLMGLDNRRMSAVITVLIGRLVDTPQQLVLAIGEARRQYAEQSDA